MDFWRIWNDKLPEDKAKYYNRTRMSMEMFSMHIGLAPQVILKDFAQHGYRYFPNAHKVIKGP